MPRYYFVIAHSGDRHEDEDGIVLADDAAARTYAHQVIRELKNDETYSSPEWTMIVEDDSGRELFRVGFSEGANGLHKNTP